MPLSEFSVFVPARLSSVRLPRKLLSPFGETTALGFLIDRLTATPGIENVTLCTTTDEGDDDLAALGRDHSINVFRGNPDDIIARFDDAAREAGADIIINVDGDDILCDPSLVVRTAEVLRSGEADFVRWTGLPLGASPVGFTARALREVREKKTVTNTATGWGRFFLDTARFRVREMSLPLPHAVPADLRVTLDYPEDYQLLRALLVELSARPAPFGVSDIVDVAVSKPEILDVVRGLNERYWQRFTNAAVDTTLRAPSSE